MKRQEIIEDTAKQLGHEKSAGQEEIDDAMGKIAEYKTEAAKYRVRGEFLKNRVKLGESADPEKDEADAQLKRAQFARDSKELAYQHKKDADEYAKKHTNTFSKVVVREIEIL